MGRFRTIFIICLALFGVGISFHLQGWVDFSLGDEGFLWYGVQRTALGEVPMRDFMAYEPGRYYWSALFAWLRGDDGIITLRLGLAVFQSIGLYSALLVLCPVANAPRAKTTIQLCLAAACFLVWYHPRHKTFDISLSIFLTAILAWLLKRPSKARFYATGCCIGLVSWFGRNHGLYGVVGVGMGGLLLMLLGGKAYPHSRGWVYLAAGLATGILPLLGMMFFVDGFVDSWLDSALAILQIGGTNLPLAIPWPWLATISMTNPLQSIREVLMGTAFVAIIAFPVVALVTIILRIRSSSTDSFDPAYAAAACMSLPYSHVVLARPDLSHLAQGIFPLLIGLFLLIRKFRLTSTPSALALLASSCIVSLPAQPFFHCRPSAKCVPTRISDSIIQTPLAMSEAISFLQDINRLYGQPDKSFLVTPLWPGAYALLHQKSPMLWQFPLFRRTPTQEQREIERIQARPPSFVLIIDYPLDGNENLRFRFTHPALYQYIEQNFTRITAPMPTHYLVFIAPRT